MSDDQPLAGLTVLELANVLAGPLVGQFCAELGAQVIKAEPPGSGDPPGAGICPASPGSRT